jgi:transaldolase
LTDAIGKRESAGPKSSPSTPPTIPRTSAFIDKAIFDKMHAVDHIASDKIKKGIEGFSQALEDLEKLLVRRLSEISEPAAVARWFKSPATQVLRLIYAR